jgi:hypothetical protein
MFLSSEALTKSIRIEGVPSTLGIECAGEDHGVKNVLLYE